MINIEDGGIEVSHQIAFNMGRLESIRDMVGIFENKTIKSKLQEIIDSFEDLL